MLTFSPATASHENAGRGRWPDARRAEITCEAPDLTRKPLDDALMWVP